MYKGNIQEFIDQLSRYCEENFNITITVSNRSWSASKGYEVVPGKYEICIWKNNIGQGYTVTDDSDFEEQVYSSVNRELKLRL